MIVFSYVFLVSFQFLETLVCEHVFPLNLCVLVCFQFHLGSQKYWWSPVPILLRTCLQVSVGKLANQFSLLKTLCFFMIWDIKLCCELENQDGRKKQKNETLCCRKNQTFFISDVIWNENDVQNNVFSEVRSQYGTVVRKWKKNQLQTRYWLWLLQNESEINYVSKWFKTYNLVLIGKHMWTCLFLLKMMLVTQYDRVAHFVIARQS